MNRYVVSWATMVTLLRIVMVPFIVIALLHGLWIWAFVLLIVAGGTDLADGFIARAYQQESVLGSYLDPLADKLLLMGCYGALWYQYGGTITRYVPSWFMVMVMVREAVLIAVSFLLFLWQTSALQTSAPMIRPTQCGKWTTVFHFFVFLTLCLQMGAVISPYGYVLFLLLYSTALLMIISGVQYAWYAWWHRHNRAS